MANRLPGVRHLQALDDAAVGQNPQRQATGRLNVCRLTGELSVSAAKGSAVGDIGPPEIRWRLALVQQSVQGDR